MEITWSDIVSKTIIVGLTFVDSNDELIKEELFYGNIVSADSQKGVCIFIDGKKDTYYLPPGLSSLQIAPPGEYKLQPTGEVVMNPDLLTNWIVKIKM